MKISNLTTRLNIKAVGIVLVFMLVFSIYHQWVAFDEKTATRARIMENYATYLERTLPSRFLIEATEYQGYTEKSPEEQVMLLNTKLQPALDNVYIPTNP
ncbi:MAG: kinE 7 [Firmicutes bacterium]|nr:kinE 7 [Bacillota bacterium]